MVAVVKWARWGVGGREITEVRGWQRGQWARSHMVVCIDHCKHVSFLHMTLIYWTDWPLLSSSLLEVFALNMWSLDQCRGIPGELFTNAESLAPSWTYKSEREFLLDSLMIDMYTNIWETVVWVSFVIAVTPIIFILKILKKYHFWRIHSRGLSSIPTMDTPEF